MILYSTELKSKCINAISTAKSIETKDKNAQQVIKNLLEALESTQEISEIVTNSMEKVLQDMLEKLIENDGNFKKIGLLRWKNIADYVSFAHDVKTEFTSASEKVGKLLNNTNETPENKTV